MGYINRINYNPSKNYKKYYNNNPRVLYNSLDYKRPTDKK